MAKKRTRSQKPATKPLVSRSKTVGRARVVVPQDDFDVVLGLIEAARTRTIAAANKTRAALAAAQRRLDVIDTRKQQAEAALAQAVADRDLAQLNLGYTELRAPIDGTVGNRAARAGAYAMVGAQLISLVPAPGARPVGRR